jgi:serine/threonine/tyrosine-interacting protein
MDSDGGPPNSSAAYVAAHPWSQRLNDAPRVPIPPPPLDFSHGEPCMTVKHSTSTDYDSNQFGNPDFIRFLITDGSVTLTHRMLDWKYGNRRGAQMVLPFLYVGPLSAVKDEHFMRETGFTLLVSVRNVSGGPTRSMDAGKLAANYGIHSYNLDIESPSDFIRKLPAAIKAVNDHLESTGGEQVQDNIQSTSLNGKVLVFCETGNERSAAFVAAYLMAVFNIDAITAIQTVQSQRFSTCVDDSIKNALNTFQLMLNATRDVGRANKIDNLASQKENLAPRSTFEVDSRRSKRSLDNFYDDDDDTMDMQNWASVQGGDGRIGEAPFQDREG